MNWVPPFLMKLRIKGREHGFAIWLPVFFLWPIVLAFLLAAFLVMLPFAIAGILFSWETGWWRPLIFGPPAVLRVCAALRGLTVDAEGRYGHFEVIFR